MKKIRLPTRDAEWQRAVDLANGLLHLDSARKYGLVTGGPEVNLARIEEILRLGRQRRILPRRGSDVAVALALAKEPRRGKAR